MTVEALRSLRRGVQHIGADIADYGIERLAVLVVIAEFGSAKTGARVGPGLIRVFDFDHHQTVRVRVRERFEQDVVDHAENGGGRTDAESQSKNGDEGEAGIFYQCPPAVRKILPESSHSHLSACNLIRVN